MSLVDQVLAARETAYTNMCLAEIGLPECACTISYDFGRAFTTRLDIDDVPVKQQPYLIRAMHLARLGVRGKDAEMKCSLCVYIASTEPCMTVGEALQGHVCHRWPQYEETS